MVCCCQRSRAAAIKWVQGCAPRRPTALPRRAVQVIDLGDNMEFVRLPGATKDELYCFGPVCDLPNDDSNLVIKVRATRDGAGRGGAGRCENGCCWCWGRCMMPSVCRWGVLVSLAARWPHGRPAAQRAHATCPRLACCAAPQALNLFRRKTGSTDFYRVNLEKVVPHGAGLVSGCQPVTG